jgi:hypothetical protein
LFLVQPYMKFTDTIDIFGLCFNGIHPGMHPSISDLNITDSVLCIDTGNAPFKTDVQYMYFALTYYSIGKTFCLANCIVRYSNSNTFPNCNQKNVRRVSRSQQPRSDLCRHPSS